LGLGKKSNLYSKEKRMNFAVAPTETVLGFMQKSFFIESINRFPLVKNMVMKIHRKRSSIYEKIEN
jgi:hypothetical protein